jgi:hypothetical protein
MSKLESKVATAALDTLHGARGLPTAEAAEKLRDFLASIGSPIPTSARLSDASSALKTLVGKLEKGEPPTNDDWGSCYSDDGKPCKRDELTSARNSCSAAWSRSG